MNVNKLGKETCVQRDPGRLSEEWHMLRVNEKEVSG